MRSLTFSGVALAALMTAQPALAEIDSGVGAPPPPVAHDIAPPPPSAMPPMRHEMRRMAPPPMVDAPRAADYQRPGYGFQLPKAWMSPTYFISDYRAFGLDRPAPGFGWSRYYDDMVLTDQWGRVYDTRGNYDGGHRDGGRGHRNSHDTDAAIAGVGGAAVGAVAGNLIAGAGSRLAGSLIGGGVGALAGLAIEAVTAKHRHEHRGYSERDYGRDDGYYHDHYRNYGPHWGGYGQSWGYYGGSEGASVTTTVVTHNGGGGGVMVPHQVVTYENVYAPVVVHSKMKERRTTKLRPRVRGDY
jgi:Ni/Co efflux regulator RcnB